MNRLAQFLADKGMSQAEFARRAGVTRYSVCRWAAGERTPEYAGLLAIAKVTGWAVSTIAASFRART